MFATVVKSIFAGTVIASLYYYCPNLYCAALLLAVWTLAIAVFVYSDLAVKFIWIPVVLGLSGVFGSMLVLALPARIALTVDLATLILFVVAVDVLKKHRTLLAAVKYRVR